MITLKAIKHAETILKKHILRTPLLFSDTFSKMFHADIYLKLENMQKTGSFKIRGATYKLHRIAKKAAAKGVIAASAGNHAQGVALAAGSLNIPSTIVMPETVSIAKQEATSAYGGKVVIHGQNIGESLEKAKEIAAAGMIFIHPYDDEDVITGQGTIGLEVLNQIHDPDLVVVPVGGGGLISGIASAVKELKPKTKIIGVQAEACPSAAKARLNRGPVCGDVQPSIADGINVGRIGDISYGILERLVDDVVLVNEEYIAAAMLLLLERKKILAEGAGAVCLAALMNRSILPPKGGKVVLLVSGGNVDSQLLGRIVAKGLLQHGRIMRFRICLDDRPGALAELLFHVAKAKANVMTINHTRNIRGVPLGRVYIDFELETRGANHIREVTDYLNSVGYRIDRPEE
ncbi:MAG: threonine ammonia-lyase [Pseudomonadota bacterium]